MPAYTTLKFRSFTNNSEDTKACANTKAWFRSLIYFMNRMCIAGKFSFDRPDTEPHGQQDVRNTAFQHYFVFQGWEGGVLVLNS